MTSKFGANASAVITSIINQILREPFWQLLGEGIGNASEPQNGTFPVLCTVFSTEIFFVFSPPPLIILFMRLLVQKGWGPLFRSNRLILGF